MLPVLAAVVLGLAAGPAASVEADDPRLEAFMEACLDGHRDPAARAAAVAAAGWRPVADNADPSLASVMALSREAMADAAEEDGFGSAVAVHGRTVAGISLYLVTTELDMPSDSAFEIDLLGCYLYDFSAVAPVDASRISARFDEDPAETIDEAGVILAQTWNVEAIEGVWDVRHTFIPEGSPVVAMTGFSGLLLKITSTRES